MYPLELDAAYPRRQWYVAGHGYEFGREIVGKKIFDEPLIFYRTDAGEPIALWGRCLHRHMPLEFGQREGDAVVCPYHGYKYEKDGHCSHIPTGGTAPNAARLRRYPLIEQGPLVWIWMGDEQSADPALLPKPAEMGLGDDRTGWRIDATKTFHLQARAALLVDNLFDLSHISFVHSKSLDIPKDEMLVEPRTDLIEGRIRVTRTTCSVLKPNSFLTFSFPDAKGVVYRESITELHNPCLINAAQWAWEALADGSKGKLLGRSNFIHIVTPETAHSTHYIGLISRDYRIDDDELSNAMAIAQDEVRQEDVVTLGIIECDLDKYAHSRREISTKADEGAVKVRSKLRQMIKAEQSTAPMAAH